METRSEPVGRGTAVGVGASALAALLAVSGYALVAGLSAKVLGIGWAAFGAMAGGAALGRRAHAAHPRGLVWGYGVASGAMVTSAAVFLVPPAIGQAADPGGFGVAAGLLSGFAAHTVGHRLSHLDLPVDRTVAELTAHALAAGSIIGVVYAGLPELGPVLGLAIVSHKAPAGYVAARRLTAEGRPVAAVLLPASGVGVAALAVDALAPPLGAGLRAAVFGFAAGVFLHVAMDFLPRCETGGEIHDAVERGGHAHELLDRLRVHAVASTGVGGAAVFLGWLLV